MTPAETTALAVIVACAVAGVVLILVLVRARLESERKLNAALREELFTELKILTRNSRDEIDQVKSAVDSTLKRLELRAMGSGEKAGSPEIDDNLKPFLAELDTLLTSIASQIIDDTRDGTRTIKESMSDLQAKLVEMSAVDKFVQLLDDRDERQRALISAIRRLGDDEVAARLAVAYPSEGAISILQDIAVSGKGNELVGWALMGVADKHLQNGKLELAETFYKQALFSLENSLGENHEDVAEILDSLAKIAMGQGRPVEAEEMLERAGKIKASLLGAEHSEVAESSIRLADLYSKQERYQEALPLYLRALEISKKSLGPDHPQCLSLLNRLAEINETLDEAVEAARFYQEIADHQEGEALNETLIKLVQIFEATSNWQRLEELYRRLIEQCQINDPRDQLKYADYMKSLARVLRRRENKTEAIAVYREALADVEDLLGPEHSDVIVLVDELSDALIDEGHLNVAAPLVMRTFKRSLSDVESDRFRRVLGKVKLLAERLVLEGEYDIAEDMYQQALTSMEKLKEPPGKAIIGLLRKICMLCAERQDYEKSEAALKRALRITELLFGEDHSETQNMLMQLGHLIQKQGNLQETEAIYKRVLEMRYKLLGTQAHPDIIESLVELAKLSRRQNNLTEAEIYEESAIEMASTVFGENAAEIKEISQSIESVPIDMEIKLEENALRQSNS